MARKEQQQRQRHAVVVPSTGFGHMNPALELSRQIALRGVEVTLVIFHEHLAAARRRVLASSGFDSARDSIHLVPFPSPFRGDDPAQPIAALAALIRDRFQGLPKPTAIISDCFVKCQDAAAALGVPRIVFWTASALSDSIFAGVPLLLSAGHIPVHRSSRKDEAVTVLPGLPLPITTRRLPLCFHGPDFEFTAHAIACYDDAARADGFLVNSIEEIESEIVDFLRRQRGNYFPVGPLTPPETDQTDASTQNHPVMDWLESQPPRSVLYIAFGTESMLHRHQFDKIVAGLAASKQKFLWSLRRFVIQAGEEVYREAEARLSGQGLVVDWVPQRAVLDHPAVAGFFTHCGWNSTLETVCAGVPALCWPFGAEQNVNSLLVTDKWEMGMEVAEGPASGVTAEEIADAIGKFVADARLREKAAEMKKVVAGVAKPGGSSDRNLNEFVSKFFPE